MNKMIPPAGSHEPSDTDHAAITRLERVLQTMLDANRALEMGDDLSLSRLGLDAARIAELKARQKRGEPGFPEYVIRNLRETLETLREHQEDDSISD
ncbi:hypothetical protein UM91_18220 [Pseudomonas oryzihabitans]|uniref:hypothetical protein n=1 Tax=Pseudomonas oryzihabitans TaxID=47885 RepID=UPI0005C95EFF|nr:hypothetical protein [Pseudomonas oryzihabitans]KIZ49145.1 hypothetical protein UM91_18220 [Pseudomonas oryzihabitans]